MCPPREDQLGIIAHVNILTAEVARAIALASREIVLLREYRTRLIANVVTGKLDVREAASRLTEEVMDEDSVEDVGDEDIEAGEEDIDLNDDADT